MAELGAGLGSGYPAAIDTKQTFTNTGSPLSDGPTRMDAEVLNDALGALIAIEAELGIAPSGVWPTLIARLDAFIVGSVAVPQLVVAGVGPHAIGGVVSLNDQLAIKGAFTGSSNAFGQTITSTLTVPVGGFSALLRIAGEIVEATSGTHDDFMSLQVLPPTITAGVADLTNASTVKITGAPIGATNNYALWVAAGNFRFAGSIGSNVNPIVGPSVDFSDATMTKINSGTTAIQFVSQSAATERMRLTEGGILALGTTVTTGAAVGDLVLASSKGIRTVDEAGTGTFALIEKQAGANLVSIAPEEHDILWGRPLIALGGGATPTFGTIGGAGPATAAQNTWMRVIDSAGAAFWVPVWK